ncbi:MAG: hypothetical protein JOZ87_25580 [Chloroflexi bacterium]|nr:hypothetical protein [Chloroflexota bacterium]
MRSADDFEDRLHNEIIVDTCGPEEQAISWYYYLDKQMLIESAVPVQGAMCGCAPSYAAERRRAGAGSEGSRSPRWSHSRTATSRVAE